MRNPTLLLAACLTGLSVPALCPAVTIEKPAIPEDALLAVTVPDLHALLDTVGALAEQVMPGSDGDALKGMLGAQLGDPGLSGIAPGRGVAVVFPEAGGFFLLAEVEEEKSDSYSTFATGMGMDAAYADGLLVVSGPPELVAPGSGLVKGAATSLFARRGSELRIAVRPAGAVEKFGDSMESWFESFADLSVSEFPAAGTSPGAGSPSADSLKTILKAEFQVLRSLARQCERAEFAYVVEDGSLGLRMTADPAAGSRLAALLGSWAAGSPNPRIRAGIFGEAVMAVDGQVGDAAALMEFVEAEFLEVSQALELDAGEVSQMLGLAEKWMGVCSGAFAETVSFSAGSGMTVGYITEIDDAEEAVALFADLEEDIKPFLGLYEDLGMPMTLSYEGAVRSHADVPIHRFEVSFSMEGWDEATRGQLAAMGMESLTYEMAALNDVLVYGLGDFGIDRAIDRLKDGDFKAPPLAARGGHAGEGFLYADVDVARYVGFIESMVPGATGSPAGLAELLAGSEPVTIAGYVADGRLQFRVAVPGSLIAKAGQAAMMQAVGGPPPQ